MQYESVNGISYQFKQRKVKWKTGRRRHAKADAAAQAAFSANFAATLKEAAVARVVAFDEGRFGLKLWFRRRWCTVWASPTVDRR